MTKVEEWKRKRNADIAEAWDQLLRQPWGRQLLFEITDSTNFCGAETSTFNENLAQQSYRNGIRDAGLRLRVAARKANPEMYLRMVTESMNESRLLLAAQKSDAAASE